jgi:hypothetical protein
MSMNLPSSASFGYGPLIRLQENVFGLWQSSAARLWRSAESEQEILPAAANYFPVWMS